MTKEVEVTIYYLLEDEQVEVEVIYFKDEAARG